jgi:hypothetical protein
VDEKQLIRIRGECFVLILSWNTKFKLAIVIEARRKGKGKGKVKISLCLTKYHAMEGYWSRGGIAPRILDLGSR